jgi:hypothetical protein
MTELSSEQIHEAFDRALKKVAVCYEAGELDLSGRYEIEPADAAAVTKPETQVKPEAAA